MTSFRGITGNNPTPHRLVPNPVPPERALPIAMKFVRYCARPATGKIPVMPNPSVRPRCSIRTSRRVFGLQLLVILLSACAIQSEPDTDSLTAQEILERMATQYAQARTYRDDGTLSMTISGPEQIFRSNQRFSTAFIRPDQFRFEYLDLPGRLVQEPRVGYIIWRSGEDLGRYFHARPEERALSSLMEGIAGGTGVSGGTAARIPVMLMPGELRGRSLARLADADRSTDSVVREQATYVVSGKLGVFDMRLWIRKSDFLILRVEQLSRRQDNTETITVIHYMPTLNSDIPPGLLEFRAPPLRSEQAGL